MMFQFRNHKFDTTDARTSFARTIAGIVMGESYEPWMPDHRQKDTYRWKVDSGNQWTLNFFETNPDRFSLTYRNQSEENNAEGKLGEWLEWCLGCKAIKE